MDKLWAPWRSGYVTGILKNQKGCVFCRIIKSKKDKENYILKRNKNCYAVLNLYPYNNGHVLIVTNRHVDDISKLTKTERDDMMDLLDEMKKILKKVLKPQGFNIGINLGRIAGAGFPGHLHIHIVPRWKGDVNFMPVTADARVISQSLKFLHKSITDANKKRI